MEAGFPFLCNQAHTLEYRKGGAIPEGAGGGSAPVCDECCAPKTGRKPQHRRKGWVSVRLTWQTEALCPARKADGLPVRVFGVHSETDRSNPQDART